MFTKFKYANIHKSEFLASHEHNSWSGKIKKSTAHLTKKKKTAAKILKTMFTVIITNINHIVSTHWPQVSSIVFVSNLIWNIAYHEVPLPLIFLGFFFKQDITYVSNSRNVEGFNVSKSISISSGLESRKDGSRDWIMCTTRPSLSPATENPH